MNHFLAYIAGFIDADGCVTINRSKRAGRLYFGAVVGISGTRREPMDLATLRWGGKVWAWTPRNPLHRPVFQWARQGKSAVRVLQEIEPILLLKQEQARIAIQLHSQKFAEHEYQALSERVFALNQD